jgi:hypothetical protein
MTCTSNDMGSVPGSPLSSRGHPSAAGALTGAALAALALTLAACGGSTAVPAHGQAITAQKATPAGSSAAARQLRGAADVMTQASNFTLSGKVSTGGSSTLFVGQFQAPDIVELTITSATDAPVMVLFAGTKSYVKAADGTWKSHLTGPAGSADPRVAFSVLDKASAVTVTSSTGDQTNFTFALPGAAAASIIQGTGAGGTTTLAGTAVVTSGTISELTLTSASSPTNFVAELHYTAVGSSPRVALPAGV